jgi:C1q domain|nr:MAG TPA: Complement C1q-like protein [Caudoviricetes sp.]
MATINDKFSKASSDSHYAVATTVAALRATNAKVLQCADVSSFPQSTVAHFVTYKKQYNPIDGTTAITNKAAWMGVANKDNNTITDLTIAPGYSDWGNAIGDVVECIPTSFWANNLVDGLLVQHDERGYLKNKSVTLANINGGSTPGVLQTDASGVVSVSRAFMSAYCSTNVAFNAGDFAVVFDKKDYDPLNMYSTETGKVIIPVEGRYHINTQVGVGSAGISGAAHCHVLKNGEAIRMSQKDIGSGSEAKLLRLQLSFYERLKKGDVLSVHIWCSESRNIDGDRKFTFFQVEVVGV